MTKKWKRTALQVLLFAVFIFSLGMFIRQQIFYRKNIVGYEKARQIAGVCESMDTDVLGNSEMESALPAEFPIQMDVDLEALQSLNPDVLGWIIIPNTELSYPLLQGEDNQYYLKRDWIGEPDAGGSIFLEVTNHQDFTDFHTIIYGHRMRNGTMFGMLKYYNDFVFWWEHPSIYIVTNSHIRQYDIFAAYETSVKGIVFQLELTGKENELIQYCVENSEIQTGIVPKKDDRLLTLSTCPKNGYSKRWVVQGYLTKEYEVER